MLPSDGWHECWRARRLVVVAGEGMVSGYWLSESLQRFRPGVEVWALAPYLRETELDCEDAAGDDFVIAWDFAEYSLRGGRRAALIY